MSKGLMDFVQAAKSRIKEVDIEQAEKLIAEGYKILDVREPGEFLMGTVEGAMNIPRGVLEAACDLNFPQSNPALRDHREDNWLVLCATGGRAAMATDVITQMGFENAINVIGGMTAWREAGKATVIPSDENSAVILKNPCVA